MKLVDRKKKRADDRVLAAFSRKLARINAELAPDLTSAMGADISDHERRKIRARAALAASEARELAIELKSLRADVASELRTMASHIAATKAYSAHRSQTAARRPRGEKK